MKKSLSIISPEIKEILRLPNKKEKLNEIFAEIHPYDIFILVKDLMPAEVAEIITALGILKGIEVFEKFKIKKQRRIFRHFSQEWMADVLEEMPPDERVDFIKALPEDRAEEILPLVAQAERNDIKKLMQFKEGTAGSILTTEYASLERGITAKEALEKLKLQAPNRETIYYIYITDEGKKLIGFISLKKLIVSRSDALINDIMNEKVISVSVNEDKEIVAKKLSDYDFLAIPVVDDNSRLIGIVTVDDVVDVVIEEDTEDILRYGAAGEYIDYMGSGPFQIARQRILWLLVLVIMGFVSGWVIQKYAFQLQAIIALAFFIPVLTASGGNAGTQSSTVVIRGLATGEVKMKDVIKVLKKEMLTGVLVGAVMGILGVVRALIANKSPLLGVTVGLAMVATVIIGTTLGAMLPLLFKKLRLDPALMSGPFISSSIDVISLFVYFQISFLIIK
ncbi:MAG: magnesium transporter [Candidatus Omnitrophota bacterium]|nr:MAG: magnesium transporter [Candidatus Omnitrophota bacterium]